MESIMLSEISQTVRDKYDLTFNWNIINRKKKKETKYNQNIEVKNNLTMDRGEWGGDSEKRGLQELL